MKQKINIKGLPTLAKLASTINGRPDDKEFDSIPVEDIYSKVQPRKVFEHIEELAESLKELGQLQPIVVSQDGNGKFVIEQGERRYRAAKLAGLSHLEAVITDPSDTDQDRLIRQLAENVQRDDMKLFELVESVSQILASGVKANVLAAKLGKDETYISSLNAVSNLPEPLHNLMSERHIQDPVALRRLKKLYELDPDQVLQQLDKWSEQNKRSDDDDGYIITRAQVLAFAKTAEKPKKKKKSPAAVDSEGTLIKCNPKNFRVFVLLADGRKGVIDPSIIPSDGSIAVRLNNGETVQLNPDQVRIDKIGVITK